MENILKIAIQKSGRLNEDSLGLFKECGIKISNGTDQLKAPADNFPIEVLFLRNSDIPQYVEDGVADVAIIGQNTVFDKNKKIDEILPLGFSKCRVCLAVPKEVNYTGIEYFNGKRIASSYPFTLNWFLEKNGVKAEIHEISGSVEIAPNIGLADGIFDIVSSGSTLFKNGLKEVQTVFKSEAAIVASRNLTPEKKEILEKLLFRIKAVQAAKNNKYIMMNVPKEKLEEVTRVLPGMKSPTVTPLKEQGWCSVQSVISETEFWDKIEKIKAAGAEGILIIPIEKMVL